MNKDTKLTTNAGAPVADNQNVMTAGPRGPMLLQDAWFLDKLAHFDREVIPERRMHGKGFGGHGTFTVTHDIIVHAKTRIFSEIKIRHIGNSLKADPAYGKGVAEAPGMPLAEVNG